MQVYGLPDGGISGMAAADAAPRTDDAAARRAEARRDIEALAVTHQSPDGAVSVTVRSSGALVGVTCSERIRTMPPRQVAAVFQACVQQAQAGVARRVEQILRTAAPDDPLTDDLVADARKAFPPPPGTPRRDTGPQPMAIGDIEEDLGPRPQRRRPLRSRPAHGNPDDWGGRSVRS